MSTQLTDIKDITNLTINNLGPMKMTELATTLRSHPGIRAMLKKNRVKIDAGPQINFNVMTDHNNSTRFVGLGSPDVVNIGDYSIKGQVDWRRSTSNWGMIDELIAINREPNRIVDYVKEQRMACLISIAEKWEDRLWKVPASSTDDNINGIPYYIVKSNTATTTNNGFNGTLPSGHTAVANIVPATYAPKWSNYATQYTDVTKDDLIRKARRMAEYTNWAPPIDNKPIADYDAGDENGWYTNYSVKGTVVEILESQNDRLGTDVAPYENSVMFMGAKLNVVPKLDDDTTGVLYMIPWGVFKFVILRDFWMREIVVDIYPGQHNVSATFVDSTFNVICYDRRKCGVLATNTTMP